MGKLHGSKSYKDKDVGLGSMTDANNENIGYGCPPKATQFKPGQSGNPKGRPKKLSSIYAIVEKHLNKKIIAKESSQSVEITKIEALVIGLINGSLKQDPLALRTLMPILKEIAEKQTLNAKQENKKSEEDLKILKRFLEQNKREHRHDTK